MATRTPRTLGFGLIPNEIDTLPAGRELDTLVAEKVMGWLAVGRGSDGQSKPHPEDWGRRDMQHGFEPVPFYSISIEAAWKVVEKLLEVKDIPYEDTDRYGRWEQFNAQFYCKKLHEMTSQEAAVSICRAVLKAVST